MQFNNTEQEIINLKIITDLLDSFVNHIVLGFSSSETQMIFPTEIHQKYFYIMFLDFLSEQNKAIAGNPTSSLTLLREICHTKVFDKNNSIKTLQITTNKLKTWLNKQRVYKFYAASLGKTYKLKMSRQDYIKICGNISKHNAGRLTGIINAVHKIFDINKFVIEKNKIYLVLDDFYEHFHNSILNYHSNCLVEMLNNIRWGIHDYLLPEYQSALQIDSENKAKYSYQHPKEVKTDFAKNHYWELMNKIRKKPPVKKFTATKYLKLRY